MMKHFNYLNIKTNLKINKFNFFSTKFIFNKNNFKNISHITLITREGSVDRSENPDFNANINWELSKVWVTPQKCCYKNKVTKNENFKNDENEICKIVGVGPLISQMDFERFLRKLGLTLSREENVYIQDGLVKGKKVRIISSDNEDANNAAGILEETQEFLNADVNILYLTDITEVGAKRFVFFDKKKKVVIANSRNLENIKKAVDEVIA